MEIAEMITTITPRGLITFIKCYVKNKFIVFLTDPKSILERILFAVLVASEVIFRNVFWQVEGVVQGKLNPRGRLVTKIWKRNRL